MAKRKGRGRLSSIDLLPPEAGDLVEWAARELAARERTQKDIHEEFNEKLLELDPDVEPISASAFNRHAIKLADMQRRMKETSQIAKSLSDQMDPDDVDELTIISAQVIKTLIMELATSAGESGLDPKGAMQLAAALRSASQAQHVSTARRQKVEEQLADKAKEAIQSVVKTGGLTDEGAKTILDKFLGVAT